MSTKTRTPAEWVRYYEANIAAGQDVEWAKEQLPFWQEHATPAAPIAPAPTPTPRVVQAPARTTDARTDTGASGAQDRAIRERALAYLDRETPERALMLASRDQAFMQGVDWVPTDEQFAVMNADEAVKYGDMTIPGVPTWDDEPMLSDEDSAALRKAAEAEVAQYQSDVHVAAGWASQRTVQANPTWLDRLAAGEDITMGEPA